MANPQDENHSSNKYYFTLSLLPKLSYWLVRDEDGPWRYPIVFNTTRLHGSEGQGRGLQATPTTTNNIMLRPHNKHLYTLRQLRIDGLTPKNSSDSLPKQQLPAPSLKPSLKQTPAPKQQHPAPENLG